VDCLLRSYVAAATGFEDAFDDFPPSPTGVGATEQDPPFSEPAESQFDDFGSLDVAQPNAANVAGTGTDPQSVADLIAKLPDLTFMLERSVRAQ
jgi:hypothetical protein